MLLTCSLAKRYFSLFLSVAVLANSLFSLSPSSADGFIAPSEAMNLEVPGPLELPSLKGIKILPDNPLCFDFVLNRGSVGGTPSQLKRETERALRYFLTSLTIPEGDLWVNLSPYENNRIVPDAFGSTDMGRDLLEEDLVLKQMTAFLMNPNSPAGKTFWKAVYDRCREHFGTVDLNVDLFNRVWIMPDTVVIYENTKSGAACIIKQRLKVMLDVDYLALGKNDESPKMGRETTSQRILDQETGYKVSREVLVPILEKEVNDGAAFARLRQAYQSLILAAWLKRRLGGTVIADAYFNKRKVEGINRSGPSVTREIWRQYVEAFEKGAARLVREEYDPAAGDLIPRKYFTGGIILQEAADRAMSSQDIRQVTGDAAAGDMVVRAMLQPSDTPPRDETAAVGKNTSMNEVDHHVSTLEAVGFFPGLGSRGSYRNLGSALYDTGIPEVQHVFREAATALGFTSPSGEPLPSKLFLIDAQLPRDPLEREIFVYTAIFVHNIALNEYLKYASKSAGTPLVFSSYTGESFGLLQSTVASGSLSVREGVALTRFFTSSMVRGLASNVPLHDVIALTREDMRSVLLALSTRFPSGVEAFKYFSEAEGRSQVNVFVDQRLRQAFDNFMTAQFPQVQISNLKIAAKFLPHSSFLTGARAALEKFIEANGIQFHDATVPIIPNNRTDKEELVAAEDIKGAVLDILNTPVFSARTAHLADERSPDLIVEIGIGDKTRALMEANNVRTPFTTFNGDRHQFDSFYRAAQLIGRLKGVMDFFREANEKEELTVSEIGLVHLLLDYSIVDLFFSDLLLNVVAKELQKETIAGGRRRSVSYYKFMDILQTVYLARHVVGKGVSPHQTFSIPAGMHVSAYVMSKFKSCRTGKDREGSDGSQSGGVDFNPNHIDFKTARPQSLVNNTTDPAMIKRLNDARGLIPVLLGIRSLPTTVCDFLQQN